MSVVLAILLGFLAGAVGGLVGVGGGILFVPALTIFLDQNQVQAEATSLLAIILVAIVGGWRQNKYGNVRLGDAIWIGLLSVPGVVIGVAIANSIPRRLLQILFAALVLIVAAQVVLKALRDPNEARKPADPAS